MYPLTYYETFMRYEASDEVFVAMPFTIPFQKAFENIIEPAIVNVKIAGNPLKATILNRSTSGSPDIHEKIFDAIIHSRLVIADMTVQASYAGDDGTKRWQANANVLYEVGLASAWRNPEDILLIYQPKRKHSYSFDIQNLRHIPYELNDPNCIARLTQEIVRALRQSTFLTQNTYLKILHSVSPSSIQFMHVESRRAFPVVSFQDKGMPIMDTRIHAVTELLGLGAIHNRNVIPQGAGKGVAIIYQWTELGLRILMSLYAINSKRRDELATQIASIPSNAIPPKELLELPDDNIALSNPKDNPQVKL